MCPRWSRAVSRLTALEDNSYRQGEPLDGHPSVTSESPAHFGHKLRTKRANTIRLMVQNINSMPEEPDDKQDRGLLEFAQKHEIDIMCLSEINTCWKYVDPSIRIPERFRGFWEALHYSVAYNQHSTNQEAFQHGGEAILSFDQTACRNPLRGCDRSGLGRWAWTRFRGSQGTFFRVVCGYCPCPSRKGATTVWSQHQNYLLTQNCTKNPRTAFKDDLLAEIIKWKKAKDQIILLIDWNEDVRGPALATWLRKAGMRDIILEQHGTDAPPTVDKDTSTYPIDGIFATEGLSASRSGYMPFGEKLYKADHRVLWVDLTFHTAFGHDLLPIPSAAARRLKLHCPDTKGRFIRTYRKEVSRHNLPDRMLRLEQVMTSPPSKEHIDEFETIDRLNVEAILYADKKCRKLRMGTIPFSPQMQEPMDLLRYIDLLIRRREGRTVNSRYIRRVRRRVKDTTLFRLSMEDLVAERRRVNLRYIKARKESANLRKKFLEELAERRADTGNTTAATELKQLLDREELRAMSRRTNAVSGKPSRAPLTELTLTDSSGATKILTDKQDMEHAAMHELAHRPQQSVDTDLMQPHMLQDLNYLGTGQGAQEILDGTYVPPPRGLPMGAGMGATKSICAHLRPQGALDHYRRPCGRLDLDKRTHSIRTITTDPGPVQSGRGGPNPGRLGGGPGQLPVLHRVLPHSLATRY